MKVLVDMNLTPDWAHFLNRGGIESIHWSEIGSPAAPDLEIIEFAKNQGYVVFTHDLDFGTALALTKAGKPSVIQIRTQDITPSSIGVVVLKNLERFQNELETGALIVIDEARSRVRILPLNS